MNDEINQLENLLIKVLDPYATVTTKKIEGKVVFCEITLKFRKEADVLRLVRTLKTLK